MATSTFRVYRFKKQPSYDSFYGGYFFQGEFGVMGLNQSKTKMVNVGIELHREDIEFLGEMACNGLPSEMLAFLKKYFPEEFI